MAHYVGQELHIRPNDILDGWGVPELIVAFGQYANQKAYEAYRIWQSQDAKYRGERPQKQVVYFIGLDDLEE